LSQLPFRQIRNVLSDRVFAFRQSRLENRKDFDKYCLNYLKREGWTIKENCKFNYVANLEQKRVHILFDEEGSSFRLTKLRDWREVAIATGHRTLYVFCFERPYKALVEEARDGDIAVHHYLDISVLDASHPVATSRAASAAKRDEELAIQSAEAGDYAEAVKHWRAILRMNPLEPRIWLHLITALEQSGHRRESEERTCQAIREFPQLAGFVIEYGWLAARAGQWGEAASRWKQGIERFPEDMKLLILYGVALATTEQYEKAEAFLANCVMRFPHEKRIGFEHAVLAGRQGHWDDAVFRWRRVVDIDPGDADAVGRLGTSLRLAGRVFEAQPLLLAAETRFAPNLIIGSELAIMAEPDWTEAVPRWRKMVEHFPANGDVLSGLVMALRRSGQSETAEHLLDDAMLRFPAHRKLVFHHADLASDRKDWDVAILRWERFLELDPNHSVARDRIAQARHCAGP
jgi:tetratricopeptide (TPR) repeat protein